MPNYPIASGHPDLSNLNWIPQLYASRLLIALYAATCIAAISNTDYEGVAKEQGDKVIIRSLPTITDRTHVKGQALVYDDPSPGSTELLLDKGRYWGFRVDLVDEKQSDIEYVDKWAKHASMTQKVNIETVAFADIYSGVHPRNVGASAGLISTAINMGTSGTPRALTSANVVDAIVDCGVVLDEQNVPDEDRWLILPSRICGLVKKSDLKDASLLGEPVSMLRNGKIGMIDRFTIYRSNCLYKYVADGATHCLFGHPMSLTWASQMVHQELLKNPNAFGDIVRALTVYGYKIVKPEAMGDLYASLG